MDRSCLDATHDLWGIPHLFVDMCTDPNDPTLRTIDLTQFFGNNDNGTRSHHIEFDEKLYFPSFVTPAATKLSDVNSSGSVSVADYLNNSSCIENGYCLRTNGTQSVKSTKRYLKVHLLCKRFGRSRCMHTATSRSPRGSYAPSGKNNKCSYLIPAFHDTEINRVFVRKNSKPCFEHTNHSYIPKNYSNVSPANIPQPAMKLAIGLIEKQVGTSLLNVILELKTGKTLSANSIQHLRKTVLHKHHNKQTGESHAMTLLRILKQTDGVRYITMTGTVDEAMKCVRLHKKYYKEKDKSKEPFKVEIEIAGKTSDEHDYVKAVVEALKLGEDEVLLGVAWSTKEGRLYHRKFPDILGVDIKFGTNNERRPHIRTIAKSGRNNSIPIVDALLPSQQAYVFAWYFEKAQPFCLCVKTLRQTQQINTDQCPTMVPAMQPSIRTMKLYGNAKDRRCKWHKVIIVVFACFEPVCLSPCYLCHVLFLGQSRVTQQANSNTCW